MPYVNFLQVDDSDLSFVTTYPNNQGNLEQHSNAQAREDRQKLQKEVKKKQRRHDDDEDLGYHTLETYQFEEGDIVVEFCEDTPTSAKQVTEVFTMYKTVDKKVKPVPGTVPDNIRVQRKIPRDPMLTLPLLPTHPPEFIPTTQLTAEHIDGLKVNKDGFLWPEEEKLMKHILWTHEATLPFEEKDCGTLSQEYFSDYIMPVVPHVPWEYKNIPFPPGIREEVIDVLQSKMEAGVYEHSQSSYRCWWFCIKKKSGSLRVIHDLQPLNRVFIWDAGLLPKVDDFVEQNVGMVCCTMFDMF